jgi:Predicted ATPase (AAA+ superfamily)
MYRFILEGLLQWKAAKERKVLLVRGARQVGKTHIVRELGKTFEYFIEVNLEEDERVRSLFENNMGVVDLCNALAAYYGTPIQAGRTLLFIDEIQASVKAVGFLRFFKEKTPGLHVVAAGSLLEFALEEITSFGVGRVQSLFMYPMSFDEFLLARGHNMLLESRQKAGPEHPLNVLLHQKLTQEFRTFLLIGGMPEVVKTYVETQDFALTQERLSALSVSLQDDFVKYKKRVPAGRIFDSWEAALHQAGQKFMYSKAGNFANQQQIKQSLDLLQKAGLIHAVYQTAANGLPMGAEKNINRFKLLPYDTGVYLRTLKLSLANVVTASDVDLVNKGALAEIFVGIEMLKYAPAAAPRQLYYWHRESKNSSAEVDYVIQQQGNCLPVEVKAGVIGKMRSLFLFLEEKKQDKGFRISLENFSMYGAVHTYPLYAVRQIEME